MTTSLRDEIRQNRPFQSAEQEAYLNIVRTAALLIDDLDPTLRAAGITFAQYNALRILRGAEPGGLCRNDVRARMLTRMPDMTRLLDRLEEAGLVTRLRDAEDRRMVMTHITRQGLEVLVALEAPVAEAHQRRLGHLSDAQLRQLVELLTLVRQAV